METWNSLFQIALKIIDKIIGEHFFLNAEYENFVDDYMKKRYPDKFDKKKSEETNFPLFDFDDIANFGIVDDLNPEIIINDDPFLYYNFGTSNDYEPQSNTETTYNFIPDYPNINEFINLWFYNPIKDHNNFIFNDLVIEKLERVYEELKKLPIEQQKGLLLLILPKLDMSCGSGDLLYLSGYFKANYPELTEVSILDLNRYRDRASGMIERELANYYCSIISNNIETRILASDRVYIVILVELGIVTYGGDYEIQSINAFSLIDNHTMFDKIRVKTSKPKSLEYVIRQYFSEQRSSIFNIAIPKAKELIIGF